MRETNWMLHLKELRARLIKAMLALAFFTLLLLPFMNSLFTLFATPLLNQLPLGSQLIATGLPATIFVPLKLTWYLALFLSAPFMLYQFWAFIAPGLYKREKKLAWMVLCLSILLFYTGIAFAYGVVFPLVFKFFINYAPTGVTPTPDINEYLSFCLKLFFAFGIAFEVPVVTILITQIGICSLTQLRNARPYVIVGAFTFGMLLTPPDVVSQIMLAIPAWFLFELGIVVASYLQTIKVSEKIEKN